MKYNTKHLFSLTLIIIISLLSCKRNNSNANDEFMIGADISVLKKVQDYGGTYTWKGEERDALEIFTENAYNYARLRLFHTPNMHGPVCNSLEYTLDLAARVKEAGMKLMLNFHYSDTWADPQKQYKPAAWEGLPFNILTARVYQYSFNVITAFEAGNAMALVRIGHSNEPVSIHASYKNLKEASVIIFPQ